MKKALTLCRLAGNLSAAPGVYKIGNTRYRHDSIKDVEMEYDNGTRAIKGIT